MGGKFVITPGDPDGIGPEVVWKALRKNHARWEAHSLLCVGARRPFDRLKARVVPADPERLIPPKETRPYIWLLEAPTSYHPEYLLEGYQSGWAIETAASLVQSGKFSALVTGPIHKGRLNRGGYPYSGHTDFLAALCGNPAPGVTMMLANEKLRVSLVTVHTALSDVPKTLSRETILRACRQTLEALTRWWGIKNPKLAVCALNPHGGEGGLFGREEIDLINPAIAEVREEWGKSATISDALPADTYFAKHIQAKSEDRADAVVCMYHDQGLIPVKLVDFPHTVNITLGLPFIRTSVDHGTGFDIAGKNKADPRSFQSAVEFAIKLTERRKRR